jgi:4,5-DOPA dioxygenase extradiol
MKNERMPVLFCAHGSPMNIIAQNDYTDMMQRLSSELPRPKAIAVVSAHWIHDTFAVTSSSKLPTIYDFYGFPKELYEKKYPAVGATTIAHELHEKLGVALDERRGLDHGAWAVLLKLYPEADIPVVQISLSKKANFWAHYEFGQKLGALRNSGVMIIASGNLTHNLHEAKPDNSPADAWALECEKDILDNIESRNIDVLCEPEGNIMNFCRAHPTAEHYIPALVALGAMAKEEHVQTLVSTMQNGSISMNGFVSRPSLKNTL